MNCHPLDTGASVPEDLRKGMPLMAMRIEDYAMIGDCRTAALVARDGSIDWLCFPRFDSGACFAALPGDARERPLEVAGGRSRGTAVRRRYRPGTLVLETEFTTASGVGPADRRHGDATPTPTVVRVVEGMRGEVPMRFELVIRFDYGSIVPWVRRHERAGSRRSPAPTCCGSGPGTEHRGEGLTTVAEFTVRRGRSPFTLAWHPSHEPPPAGPRRRGAIRDAEVWWRDWSRRCQHVTATARPCSGR